jgi:hypothetical protein
MHVKYLFAGSLGAAKCLVNDFIPQRWVLKFNILGLIIEGS